MISRSGCCRWGPSFLVFICCAVVFLLVVTLPWRPRIRRVVRMAQRLPKFPRLNKRVSNSNVRHPDTARLLMCEFAGKIVSSNKMADDLGILFGSIGCILKARGLLHRSQSSFLAMFFTVQHFQCRPYQRILTRPPFVNLLMHMKIVVNTLLA